MNRYHRVKPIPRVDKIERALPKSEKVRNAKVDPGACRRAADVQEGIGPANGDHNPKRRKLTFFEESK